jgi:hypothetical protein
MIKFKFKWTNKKITSHYRLSTLTPGSTTCTIYQMVALTAHPIKLKLYHPPSPSRTPKQGIPPRVLTLATPGLALPLSCWNQLSS